jgi:hypothetical protein
MDAIQFLINKLANAAKGGEDNMALLEIVEEIKAEILANDTTNAIPVFDASSVSVVLPQGFKIKTTSQDGRQVATDISKLTAPKPPSVVAAFSTRENPVQLPMMEQIVEEPIAPIIPTQSDALSAISGVSFSINEKCETKEPDAVHSPWMPALPAEETLELPITDEMVHEAVALENLSKMPAPVVEPNMAETQVLEEKAEPKDLNQKLAQRSKALNEIFTKKEPVLAEVLAEPKITDLRKAISINEKYQYIDSLFRGDEQMFERSIKTLNNFDILPEAQYWMQRELLIKLGWNEEDELVQRFFTLVSRRFA